MIASVWVTSKDKVFNGEYRKFDLNDPIQYEEYEYLKLEARLRYQKCVSDLEDYAEGGKHFRKIPVGNSLLRSRRKMRHTTHHECDTRRYKNGKLIGNRGTPWWRNGGRDMIKSDINAHKSKVRTCLKLLSQSPDKIDENDFDMIYSDYQVDFWHYT